MFRSHPNLVDRSESFAPVDESVQSWCLAALSQVESAVSHCNTGESSDDGRESIVDFAAFLKLARVQRISIDLTSSHENAAIGVDGEILESLIEVCPLTDATPVEVLGRLHEFLVAQRGRKRRSGSKRSTHSRKTNGVFYTPSSIVDYIVQQTVGRRLQSMTPHDVERLAILDPSAGCGAFLLGAYRYLLKWHLEWYQNHDPLKWPMDVQRSGCGWTLTMARRQAILSSNLYGVDLDLGAIDVARRTLLLEMLRWGDVQNELGSSDRDRVVLKSNLKQGHALLGPGFSESNRQKDNKDSTVFSWADEFPGVAERGGFDVIMGNPPYRRERDFKHELDQIGQTSLGRFRSPRMDLWYYFVHRGIDLLRDKGTISFITNAYWLRSKGAEKLIATLRDDVHLDELVLLRDCPVFPGVMGQHAIFSATNAVDVGETQIKILSNAYGQKQPEFSFHDAQFQTFSKPLGKLFQNAAINAGPDASTLVEALDRFPRLGELGTVRQGIAENPSTINRRTLEKYREAAEASGWQLGEGVFALTPDELKTLQLSTEEHRLVRPYHDLCDLGRYWSASSPSRRLIYSTRTTCPAIEDFPILHRHLSGFRTILEARRETREGNNHWWHLHWPRDERIWLADKVVILQMTARPSCVPTFNPTYVSFSANVFVPGRETREDLRYFAALLNSRVLWAWFEQQAKHRGVGLELNGHVVERAPIRTINFQDRSDRNAHEELVSLVDRRLQLERQRNEQQASDHAQLERDTESIEQQIDERVCDLYQLDVFERELVNQITAGSTDDPRHGR